MRSAIARHPLPVLIACLAVIAAVCCLTARGTDSYVTKKTPLGGEEWQEAFRKIVARLDALSKDADAHAQEVIFLICSLPEYDNYDETRVLRQIVERSRNEDVLEQACKRLGRIVKDSRDARQDTFNWYRDALRFRDPLLRAAAAQGLRWSRDVRFVQSLYALLDDPDRRARGQAVQSLCSLLNWDEPRMDLEGQWVGPFKAKLQPVLAALNDLDGAIKKGK